MARGWSRLRRHHARRARRVQRQLFQSNRVGRRRQGVRRNRSVSDDRPANCVLENGGLCLPLPSFLGQPGFTLVAAPKPQGKYSVELSRYSVALTSSFGTKKGDVQKFASQRAACRTRFG